MPRAPGSNRFFLLAAAVLFAAPPARAQAGLSGDDLKLFGGSYASDCANPAAPRLRVDRDALTVARGNQRLTARGLMASYSYFGNSPPPGFRGALSGNVRGAEQLTFLAYADRLGTYIRIEGDPQVRAALGAALLAPKYRRCDAAGEPRALPLPPAPPPAPPPPAARGDAVPHLGALMADPAFKRIYFRALGPKAAQPWLARLDGPAPETRALLLEGTRYVVIAACKAHDCYDHSAVFLYSAAQARVVGLIQQQGVKTLVGAPPASLAAQLDRLWQADFRQR